MMSIYGYYFNNTLAAESEGKAEQTNPNAAWAMHKRLKALTDSLYECAVCGGPCDVNDTISLDSGEYFICGDNCANEAVETF